MKQYLVCIAAFGFLCACDSNTSMCDEHEDCIGVCAAYDGNDVMYACSEGACRCLQHEALACTGDAATDRCAEICGKFRPGTAAVCAQNFCECREKECVGADGCAVKCAGAAKMACIEGFCRCLDASALACAGDDADAYCAGICEIYEPGSISSCSGGACECKTTSCASELECASLCASVGAAMTACVSGRCECVSREALACSGENGASRCAKICGMYRPDSLAVCQNGTCACKDL